MSRFLGILCGVAVGLLPLTASADFKGQILRAAEVYTSPGRYPIVGRVARGDAVQVASCNSDNTWCEIGSGNLRGWVIFSAVEIHSRGKPMR
jgi:uncharacterized protein YraI